MLNKIINTSAFIVTFLSIAAYASTGVITFKDEGFVGKFYPSSSTEKRIAVLVLGGSEGGIPDKLAKPIAEAGFSTLALAYFNALDLPQELEKIPLEYFDHAKLWLKKQKNVKQDQLIVVGWSKGAELALLLASRDASIQRVVAIAPSSAVWAGILKDWTKVPASSWTDKGEELPFIPFNPTGKVNGLLDLYAQSLESRADMGKANIPVGNIRGKVFLMTGENDEIWPSPQMSDVICQQMNSKRDDSCQHINYLGLNHLLNYKFINKAELMNKTFLNMLTSDL